MICQLTYFYEVVSLKKHAILCGSAPDGFTQKKINEMHDFLTTEAGGFWAEKEITIFPNGVTEAMLSFLLERLKADKTEQILLYLCTLSPVSDEDKSVWLGGEEVKKNVIDDFIEFFRALNASWGAGAPVEPAEACDIQVVYDFDRQFVREEDEADA